MTNPLVSIIIPSYNYAHLIEETLVSVANQEYSNWECIIIDDGSTDNTEAVVNNFISEYPEYKFFYYRFQNAGTSAAKNAGIDLAKGELIQFLDADDLISPRKLNIQVEKIRSQDVALVFSVSKNFSVINNVIVQRQAHPDWILAETSLCNFELLQRLIFCNVVTISSPLVFKYLVLKAGGFDPELKNNEDWIFWFKVALLKPIFLFDGDEQSFVNIRMHGVSATKQRYQMFLGEVRVREEFTYLLNQHLKADESSALHKLNFDLLALHHIRSLDLKNGFSYIYKSFMKYPGQNYSLLRRGIYKFLVRIYKKTIKNGN